MPKIKKITIPKVWGDGQWVVRFGRLNAGRGRPEGAPRLFKVLGEKLPFEAINKVNAHLRSKGIRRSGVYVAHDSMGYARYIGRGNIFTRLRSRRKSRELQLKYFSFYIVEDKKHEREIETLLIRAAGPLLLFNTKKKRLTISPGNLLDYEAGTRFFERRYIRGKKPKHK